MADDETPKPAKKAAAPKKEAAPKPAAKTKVLDRNVLGRAYRNPRGVQYPKGTPEDQIAPEHRERMNDRFFVDPDELDG